MFLPNDPFVVLSVLLFLPAVAALLICLMPQWTTNLIKLFSLMVTAVVFLITVLIAIPGGEKAEGLRFALGTGEMQYMFSIDWIPSFNINYFLGFDGISFPLIMLTSFLCLLAMGASFTINRHVKAYCVLFLLLETGMLGVFLALDFFLFYVLWEVMLLPMYFSIV